MNIQIAAQYMEQGYRVRRPSWDERTYLFREYNGVVGQRVRVLHPSPPDTYENHTWSPRMFDVVADDWELVLEGITNNYGTVQYEENK